MVWQVLSASVSPSVKWEDYSPFLRCWLGGESEVTQAWCVGSSRPVGQDRGGARTSEGGGRGAAGWTPVTRAAPRSRCVLGFYTGLPGHAGDNRALWRPCLSQCGSDHGDTAVGKAGTALAQASRTHGSPWSVASTADHPGQGGTWGPSHLSSGRGEGTAEWLSPEGASASFSSPPSLSKVHSAGIYKMPVICQGLS